MSNLSHKTVIVNNEKITIWQVNQPNAPYSAIYQNKDTKNLDRLFCLDGSDIVSNSSRHKNLERSVELTALGHTHTEHVLRYFVRKAIVANYFIGIKEHEFKKQIFQGENLGNIHQLKYKHIQQALDHKDYIEKDGLIERVSYLRRINVEGVNVLFPRNLRRFDLYSDLC